MWRPGGILQELEGRRWGGSREGAGQGKRRLKKRRKTRKRSTRGISSATLLGSACCHSNSSKARRAADRQIPSFVISASLYVSRPDISGQLILVPGCACLLVPLLTENGLTARRPLATPHTDTNQQHVWLISIYLFLFFCFLLSLALSSLEFFFQYITVQPFPT